MGRAGVAGQWYAIYPDSPLPPDFIKLGMEPPTPKEKFNHGLERAI